ncbi:unnamed protein product [Cuscuta europaea]|uniref:Thioredoxin domain-containing protein n=1 Tax=Cuscuta europaea TaxID=41803 RepID=A0A9P0Z1V2_CUSEU|nr:unnamed protein product [Cuscuta europaea]
MILLFGMELHHYLAVSTTTSVVVDRSADGDFLRIDFNISFPALSCEFASVDVSDVLGTNRLNITKTVRKYAIDSNLRPTGSEFQSGAIENAIKHDDEVDEEHAEGSVTLTGRNFDRVSHQYPILAVNFYAPWCYWSNRLKPSWEKAASILKEDMIQKWMGGFFWERLIVLKKLIYAEEITYKVIHLFESSEREVILEMTMDTIITSLTMETEIRTAW